MIKYLIRRILSLIPILIAVSFLTCIMVNVMPGDPARIIAGDMASEEDLQAIREKYGFDRPIYEQYVIYLKKILQGDFGRSTKTGRPVILEIATRFPNTLKLSLLSITIAVVFGSIFGILSAVKKYSAVDNTMMFLALVGVSMPSFYFALMMMLIFSVNLGILPLIGGEGLTSLILPAVSLSFSSLATIARMVRSSMIEVMSQDYILNAKSQGFSERKVIFGHALKNSMITLITVAGLQFGRLMGGAVVIEKVFAFPGLGQFIVDAINARDMAVVQSSLLVIAATFVFVNLVVDMLYVFINPQISYD